MTRREATELDTAGKRLDFVDALRGFAILAVIALHTAQIFPPHRLIAPYAYAGQRGVQLFFVLSAFTLFLSNRQRAGREQHPLRNFVIRRFFRIAPAYYIAVLAYAIKNGSSSQFFDPGGNSASDVVLNLLFLHGWSPTTINAVVPGGWSIAIEVGAYMLMPLAFIFLTSRKRILWAIGITYLCGVCITWFVYHWLLSMYPAQEKYLVENFVYFWLPSQLVIFETGFLLYFLSYEPTRFHRWLEKGNSGLLLLVAIVALLVLPLLHESGYPVFTLVPLYGFAFCLVALSLSVHSPFILVNRVTRHIGRVSYGMYLLHFSILAGVGMLVPTIRESVRFFLGYPLTYLLVVAATTLAATVTYFLVERPGQAVGRALIGYLERRRSVIEVQTTTDPGI
ncbi:MAG TPA: acyltransferase [Gemmatimonadaceae bacterium]|nr:acyltransferase [Gemmatimonadaceae bacterium]